MVEFKNDWDLILKRVFEKRIFDWKYFSKYV